MAQSNALPNGESTADSADESSDLTDVQALMIGSKACRSISTGQPEPASFDKDELSFAADWLGTMSDIFTLGGLACQSIATGQPESDTLNKDDLTVAWETIWLLALVVEAGETGRVNSN